MNKCPKLGREYDGLNGRNWVYLTCTIMLTMNAASTNAATVVVVT